MAQVHSISLARTSHAAEIASMSRTYVEHGLRWRYTAARIRQCIAHPAMNVAVVDSPGHLGGHLGGDFRGFAIMEYLEDAAHLTLLTVYPNARRAGVGSALVTWLEEAARCAGIGSITVETRVHNYKAIALYEGLGFSRTEVAHRYYDGVEDAWRLRKNLIRARPT
jgi:ribosomal protein S18 acetylase RimI-like enzyme